MQKVLFFDRRKSGAEKIMKFPFLDGNPEFSIEDRIVTDFKALNDIIAKSDVDILIYYEDAGNPEESQRIFDFFKKFSRLRIIVISRDASYLSVRKFFINGVFDYLVEPVSEEVLKESFLRMYESIGESYVVNYLKLKVDALIDNIFLGGGQEEFIIETIFEQIFRDWKDDPVNSQIVSDKAKTYVYETLIRRKPWLEKFLFKNDFYHRFGFSLKSKEELISIWLINFKEASSMVKKYQMIDDKLVYKIGKYAVVHVDEMLSLEDVSKGVFLNSCYISHIFKKVTGMSFVNFMTEVKIDRAKVLLRDKNARINEIASTLGYANQEYFTKIFKRLTGVTPVEYKEMLAQRYVFLEHS